MKISAGPALALLTLTFGSAAMAQNRPWPTDPPQAQQQTAPWPGSAPPAQPPAPAFPSNAPQQQPSAPWPGNGPSGKPTAMMAPPPAMAAPPPMMGGGPPPGAGPGPGGQVPPCVAQFMSLRDKVEKNAQTAKAASERHAPRDEMCKLVTAYFSAEVQWIKYTKENGSKCGIPEQVAKQIEGVHVRTGNIRKQICSSGPSPASAAPSLADALGTTTMPTPETTKTGPGTLDTLTGNALKR